MGCRVADYLTQKECVDVCGRCGVITHAASLDGAGNNYELYKKAIRLGRNELLTY